MKVRKVVNLREAKRRAKAIKALLKLRKKKQGFSDVDIRAAREYGRP
jgi:hypothetical protein